MHPVHTIINSVSKLSVPQDVFLLLVSFLPFGSIPHLPLLHRKAFTDKEEFYMSKPTHTFEQTIWHYRVSVCPALGIVLYGLHILGTKHNDHLEHSAVVKQRICESFDSYLAISGHSQCARAFHKMLTGREDDISQQEHDYIVEHFAADWAAQFYYALTVEPLRTVEEHGLDYIILSIARCMLDRGFSDETHLQIANFLLSCVQFTPIHQMFANGIYQELIGEILYLLTMHENVAVRDIGEVVKGTYLAGTAWT